MLPVGKNHKLLVCVNPDYNTGHVVGVFKKNQQHLAMVDGVYESI
jgi:hypothetical protein